MKRIPTILFLALTIVLAPCGPAVRGQQQSAHASETTKAEVERRLSKKEERVKVKLRNGSQVKGRITQTSDTGFTLTDEKTGSRTDLAYADVLDVEFEAHDTSYDAAATRRSAVATQRSCQGDMRYVPPHCSARRPLSRPALPLAPLPNNIGASEAEIIHAADDNCQLALFLFAL